MPALRCLKALVLPVFPSPTFLARCLWPTLTRYFVAWVVSARLRIKTLTLPEANFGFV